MSFGHERLDVYRAAIEYVGWAYHLCERQAGAEYAAGGIDTDGDSDTDPEGAGRTEQVPNKTPHQTGATRS